MGKLNIAHHKSYHPYRRDNIERVRKDEEEARLKEEKEDARMMLADSEGRIDALRERASLAEESSSSSVAVSKKKPRRDDDIKALDRALAAGSSTIAQAQAGPVMPTTKGHINFFEDLEMNAITASFKSKKSAALAAAAELEKGVPLAPSKKDLKPWYVARDGEPNDLETGVEEERAREKAEEKKKRDAARKSMHDPLTSITQQLASRPSSSSTASSSKYPPRRPTSTQTPPAAVERLTRESSERERALALIRRKKKEAMMGGETPSTVHGGEEDDGGYGDVYNRGAVEEAHRHRERGRSGWGGGRERRGSWGDGDSAGRKVSWSDGGPNRERGYAGGEQKRRGW